MDIDDGIRGRFGVVATLVDLGDGTLRLVFDDVNRLPGSLPPQWETVCLFTCFEHDKQRIVDLRLGKDELARIGENLLLRLAALSGFL